MAQILVRGLNEAAVDRLRKRAEASRRSLEAEVRDILETASRRISVVETAALAARIRHELSGRQHCDSASLIREDRDR
jgi:plasmid stability protein